MVTHNCNKEGVLERIEDKIDNHSETLSSIRTTLELNTQSLQEHMRRTVLLEDALKPISRIYAFGTVTIKIITLIGVIVSIATAISKLH